MIENNSEPLVLLVMPLLIPPVPSQLAIGAILKLKGGGELLAAVLMVMVGG